MTPRGDVGRAWRLAVRLRQEPDAAAEALAGRYARALLVALDADPARLSAVAGACRRRELRTRRWPRPWSARHTERAHTWSAAARLSKIAAFRAAHAGGDAGGRARLLGEQRVLLHHNVAGGGGRRPVG